MRNYRIAMLPGDGVGPEVAGAARLVLERIAALDGQLAWQFDEYPWGAGYYLDHGVVMPGDALETLRGYDAIFLGAVGDPRVPDHIPASQSLLRIRQTFDQYVNLRPIRLLPGITSPLAGKRPGDVDFVIVRENSEGEYVGAGGRAHRGTAHELGTQVSIFTRHGCERVQRFAFELARRTGKKVTSVTKGNALTHALTLWDEVFDALRAEYADVEAESMLVDAAAMHMVRNPERFDIIVTTNLFGDILSDIGAAVMGGMGLAPSGNLNPERTFPSLFEPIHGSAPDIAGRGVANPIGAIWSAQLLLDTLGETRWAERLLSAIETTVADTNLRTPDLGGSASTEQVAEAVIGQLD